VETVVEGTGRRRGGSSLRSGVYAMWVVLAAEKRMPMAVVATIERGRPFIDVGITGRGGKKAREEARSGRKKERECAVVCEHRRRVKVAQRRRDVSPTPPSLLRQSCDASFVCHGRSGLATSRLASRCVRRA
jgi:hypothetical protein